MYNMAICDDDELMAKCIKTAIENQFNKYYKTYDIDIFTSGEELLQSLKGKIYKAIFLDIDMPKMSGMDVAAVISNESKRSNIIFVTNHDDMVYDAIHFGIFRFIRKSRIKIELEEAVTSLIDKLQTEKVIFSNADSGKAIRLISEDIIYIEIIQHYLYINYRSESGNKVVKIRETLKQCEVKLLKTKFARVHISYIVNYKYVKDVKSDGVILDTGEKIPISRKKVNTIKDEYMDYVRKCVDANN